MPSTCHRESLKVRLRTDMCLMIPLQSDGYALGSVVAWLVLPSSVAPIVSPFNVMCAARRCGQFSAAVSRPSRAVGQRFG